MNMSIKSQLEKEKQGTERLSDFHESPLEAAEVRWETPSGSSPHSTQGGPIARCLREKGKKEMCYRTAKELENRNSTTETKQEEKSKIR